MTIIESTDGQDRLTVTTITDTSEVEIQWAHIDELDADYDTNAVVGIYPAKSVQEALAQFGRIPHVIPKAAVEKLGFFARFKKASTR